MGCLSSKQKSELITISENTLIELLHTLDADQQIVQVFKLLADKNTQTNKKNQVVLNRIAGEIRDLPLAPPKLERQTNMHEKTLG